MYWSPTLAQLPGPDTGPWNHFKSSAKMPSININYTRHRLRDKRERASHQWEQDKRKHDAHRQRQAHTKTLRLFGAPWWPIRAAWAGVFPFPLCPEGFPLKLLIINGLWMSLQNCSVYFNLICGQFNLATLSLPRTPPMTARRKEAPRAPPMAKEAPREPPTTPRQKETSRAPPMPSHEATCYQRPAASNH